MDVTWSWAVGALASGQPTEAAAQRPLCAWLGRGRSGLICVHAWRASPWQAHAKQHGAVLFEVVLALALLVGAAAVIGGGLTAAIQSVERLRLSAHAMDLAMTVVSELQMGSLSASPGEARPFEPPFEDWTWEVVHQSMEAGPGADGALTLVEVVIRHKDPPFVYRLTHALPVSSKPASGEPATSSAPAW